MNASSTLSQAAWSLIAAHNEVTNTLDRDEGTDSFIEGIRHVADMMQHEFVRQLRNRSQEHGLEMNYEAVLACAAAVYTAHTGESITLNGYDISAE